MWLLSHSYGSLQNLDFVYSFNCKHISWLGCSILLLLLLCIISLTVAHLWSRTGMCIEIRIIPYNLPCYIIGFPISLVNSITHLSTAHVLHRLNQIVLFLVHETFEDVQNTLDSLFCSFCIRHHKLFFFLSFFFYIFCSPLGFCPDLNSWETCTRTVITI